MEFQGKTVTFPRLIELINRQFLKNCYPYKIAQQECHKHFKFIMLVNIKAISQVLIYAEKCTYVRRE